MRDSEQEVGMARRNVDQDEIDRPALALKCLPDLVASEFGNAVGLSTFPALFGR